MWWNSVKSFFSSVFTFFRPFAKEAAKTAIGVAVEEMRDAAKAFVRAADKAPLGTNKYEYARKRMKQHYPNAKDSAIDLAIQMALAVIKDEKEKKK